MQKENMDINLYDNNYLYRDICDAIIFNNIYGISLLYNNNRDSILNNENKELFNSFSNEECYKYGWHECLRHIKRSIEIYNEYKSIDK